MIQMKWIAIPNGEGTQTDAFLALPRGGSGPGLLLFQEIFGVNRHIREVAEQYAHAGYVVLAPDVFWAQARRVELGYDGEDWNRAIQYMQGTRQEALIADIKAYADALRARTELSSKKVAALGYCMGGRMAYFAAVYANVDAAVCYYGGGIHNNLQNAATVRGALQFHFGAKDSMIPLDAVDAVRAAHPTSDVNVFDAEHGFNCWDRATYDPRSARIALAYSLEFLAENV
jgi:carboxymethylenebutenolidase